MNDRGQRSVVAYDARGDTVWAARQMVVIPTTNGRQNPNRVYDDAHTYRRSAEYDHGGRAFRMTLPRDPDFDASGAGPLVRGRLRFNARSLPRRATLSIDGFDPKAPPPKTPAFWDIVSANQAPEDA